MTGLARALGAVPSGLFIVTAGRGKDGTGFLASFVQQAGFAPPAVTMAVKRGRPVEELIRQGGAFCLSILDDYSKGLLAHFAPGFELGEPAFEGVAIRECGLGIPILADALAHLECRVIGEAGWSDHVLFCGEVVGGGHRGHGRPLLHVRKNGLSY